MFRRKATAWIGILVTGFYAAFLLWIVLSDWNDFNGLKPNEWGDFLAGSLGPLAIFWLILSFFQQGRELQLSVEALNLQAQELKNSVSHQAALVEVNREKLLQERMLTEEQTQKELEERKPRFALADRGNRDVTFSSFKSFVIVNLGGDANDVTGTFPVDLPVSFPPVVYWPKGKKVEVQIPISVGRFGHSLKLHFRDSNGRKLEQSVHISML